MEAHSGWLAIQIDVRQNRDRQKDTSQGGEGPPMVDDRQDPEGDPDDEQWPEAPAPDSEDREPGRELLYMEGDEEVAGENHEENDQDETQSDRRTDTHVEPGLPRPAAIVESR